MTAFDCHLDSPEFLLEELTGALHNASGGFGDELVFGRRGEGEARPYCSTDACAHFFEREFDLSNRQERGMYKLLGGVDGGLFVEKGESSQSR